MVGENIVIMWSFKPDRQSDTPKSGIGFRDLTIQTKVNTDEQLGKNYVILYTYTYVMSPVYLSLLTPPNVSSPFLVSF